MAKRIGWVLFLTTVLIAGWINHGQHGTAYAQAGVTPTPTDSFRVSIRLTGVIQSVTPDTLVLTDGTSIHLTPDTAGLQAGLQPGMTVAVTGYFDQDQLTAQAVVSPVTSAAVDTVTPVPTTVSPTLSSTSEDPPTPTAVELAQANCASSQDRSIAVHLAKIFKATEQEILTWYCHGHDFGEIAQAYALARQSSSKGHTPLTVQQIFVMRAAGLGWPSIAQAAGVTVQSLTSEISLESDDKEQAKDDHKGNERKPKDKKEHDDKQNEENKGD
jgi:hypothetical protein